MSGEKAEKNGATLIEGWSKQYGRPISPSELQEINGNLSHFFTLMLSWEKQFKKKELIHDAGN